MRTHRHDRDDGFTLIELLVVVIIIGILAAIAVPVFLRQRERGFEAQMVSDLRNAAIRMEQWYVDNDGVYDVAAMNGFNPTTGVTTTAVVDPGGVAFCITASHSNVPDRVYDSDGGGLLPIGSSC